MGVVQIVNSEWGTTQFPYHAHGVRFNSHIRLTSYQAHFNDDNFVGSIQLICHWGRLISFALCICSGRCARSGGFIGKVWLIITPKSMSGTMVKPCMRSFVKSCREGTCIRLACLKVLYLDCMPRAKMDTIINKVHCTVSCETKCSCQLCSCCTNCALVCMCPNK